MSYKWDNMTKAAWNDSEVMKQMEKELLSIVSKFEKIAAFKEDLKQVNESIKETSALLNGVDDGEGLPPDEHEPPPSIDIDELDFLDDEHQSAKKSLIDDLLDMAREAALKGNIKLAYKIERAIDEIIEEY